MIRRKKGWKSQPRGPDGRWVKSSAQIRRSGKGRRRPIRFLRVGRCTDKDDIFTVRTYTEKKDPENIASEFRKVLNKSFTERERKLLRKEGLELRVRELDDGDDEGEYEILGEYVGKVDGKHVINVDPDHFEPETLTHETVHILQECDDTRPTLDKKLRNAELDVAQHRDRKRFSEMETLKEALTEAETLSRRRVPSESVLGYYDKLGNRIEENQKLKNQDHAILHSNRKIIRQGNHVGNVYNKFRLLNIRKLRSEVTGRTAEEIKRDYKPRKKA